MYFANLTVFIFVIVLSVCKRPPQSSRMPVIGILTEPVLPEFKGMGKQYLAASYVKWAEAGGAQVIPIRADKYASDLPSLFKIWNSTNGFIFPGGGVYLAKQPNFMTVMEALMKWSEQAYNLLQSAPKKSSVRPFRLEHLGSDFAVTPDYIPMWFTCMSFQAVTIATANNNFSVLSYGFDSENLQLPLDINSKLVAQSKMFSQSFGSHALYPELVDIITSQPVTMNNHHGGVTPSSFYTNPILPNVWNVLSTNVDRNNREFISTMEHKQYPFYATQWHPEKNIFEWPDPQQENIPHWGDAIYSSSALAHFLVSEARRSVHTCPFDTLSNLLIYNYPVTYTGNPHGPSTSFRQTYLFD